VVGYLTEDDFNPDEIKYTSYPRGKKQKKTGAFFPYYHKTNFDLSFL
jgi:hypothetical protein